MNKFLAFFCVLLLAPCTGLATIVFPFPAWTPEMQKCAEGGDPVNQMVLGQDYSAGWGVKQDKAKGIKWLRRAAEHKYAPAEIEIGKLHEGGYGVKRDYAEAMKWYRTAADQGSAEALRAIGRMYERGYGVNRDAVQAEKFFRMAAEKGDAMMKFDLGYRYATGSGGLKEDKSEGMKWYQRAADGGVVQAFMNIGDAYEHGWGVEQNDEEAHFWKSLWDKQLDNQDQSRELEKRLTPEQKARVEKRVQEWKPSEDTIYGLGQDSFNQGRYKRALDILQPLAEKGEARAQNIVGQIYDNGSDIEEVKQDYAEALKWYRKAAEQGYWKAQRNIAMMYLNGWGIKQDDAEAYFWLSLAALTGKAFILDDAYYQKMLTPEQKADVDKRVAEWIRANPVPAKAVPQ